MRPVIAVVLPIAAETASVVCMNTAVATLSLKLSNDRHYRAVLERYCIPLEEACNSSYNVEEPPYLSTPMRTAPWDGACAGTRPGHCP